MATIANVKEQINQLLVTLDGFEKSTDKVEYSYQAWKEAQSIADKLELIHSDCKQQSVKVRNLTLEEMTRRRTQ